MGLGSELNRFNGFRPRPTSQQSETVKTVRPKPRTLSPR